MNRDIQEESQTPGKHDMTVVATDKIQVAYGLMFTLFVLVFVVFTGALVIVVAREGLYGP